MEIERRQPWERFLPKNFQPGTPDVEVSKICPMYLLIKQCAKLAGEDTKDMKKAEKYCGWNQNYERGDGDMSSTQNVIESEPYATCAVISRKLGLQLSLVHREIHLTVIDENTTDPILISRREYELQEIADRKIVIARWKNIIVSDAPGVKPKVENISDEEAIRYAKLFWKVLNAKAAGSGMFKRGENCSQRP